MPDGGTERDPAGTLQEVEVERRLPSPVSDVIPTLDRHCSAVLVRLDFVRYKVLMQILLMYVITLPLLA